jgi:DNA-binding beta-propeller fold protein YncE
VARLDLTRGSVDDVRSEEEELQEPMRGTARAQTVAPDGRRLYTLYTRDATADEPAESFVHVLDLDAETASCVDLPAEFATDPLGAVAVTPSGTRLFVYSPAAGALAELDTNTLEISRTGTVPPPSGAVPASVRATATESTLYLSVYDRITSVTIDDLSGSDWTYAPGEITGIEPATDDSSLYVVLIDRVLVVDPRTLVRQRELAVPLESVPVDHVAPALPPISPGYAKCAC